MLLAARSNDTASPAQEKSSSLHALKPENGGAQPRDIKRAEEAKEPVIPLSCQAVMNQVNRQIHDGYEWSTEDVGQDELPDFGSLNPAACNDTGRNPAHCLAPEPQTDPILPAWDGFHYDEAWENARSRLGDLLDRVGNAVPLPSFGPSPAPLPELPRTGSGSRLPRP